MVSSHGASSYFRARERLKEALQSHVPNGPHVPIDSVGRTAIGEAVLNAADAYVQEYWERDGSSLEPDWGTFGEEDAAPSSPTPLRTIAMTTDAPRRIYDALAVAYCQARDAAGGVTAPPARQPQFVPQALPGERPFLNSSAEVMAVIDAAAHIADESGPQVRAFVAAELSIPGFDLVRELGWPTPSGRHTRSSTAGAEQTSPQAIDYNQPGLDL